VASLEGAGEADRPGWHRLFWGK